MSSSPLGQARTLKRKRANISGTKVIQLSSDTEVQESTVKRSRTDPTMHHHPIPKKSESSNVYYEDGNIVIIAEDIAFRVHQSVLSKRCEVFSDMFVVGRPTSLDETFEDCPVVRVSDSAKDWELFLEVLYGYQSLDVQEQPEHVKAVLRLGKKYRADALYKKCLLNLEKVCPVRLSDMDVIFSYKDGRVPFSGRQFAKVLLEVDALYLLPAILYSLCRVKDAETERLDLSPDTHTTLNRGLHNLATEYSALVEDLPAYKLGSEECCKQNWAFFHKKLLKGVKLDPNKHRPLEAAREIASLATELCRHCLFCVNERISKFREDLFERLPEIFGLGGSWEELRKSTYDEL